MSRSSTSFRIEYSDSSKEGPEEGSQEAWAEEVSEEDPKSRQEEGSQEETPQLQQDRRSVDSRSAQGQEEHDDGRDQREVATGSQEWDGGQYAEQASRREEA